MPSKATIPLQVLLVAMTAISCVLNAVLGHWVVSAVFAVTTVLNAVLLVMYRRAREAGRILTEPAPAQA